MAYIHLTPLVKNKFRAQPTLYNGHRFASKKEANYAAQLDVRKIAGDISYYLKQVPFHLPGNVRYVVDFAVFYPDGRVQYVDVKGMKTQTYKLKKKQVEALYPIQITEA
jgi:hypothetical protein